MYVCIYMYMYICPASPDDCFLAFRGVLPLPLYLRGRIFIGLMTSDRKGVQRGLDLKELRYPKKLYPRGEVVIKTQSANFGTERRFSGISKNITSSKLGVWSGCEGRY